MFLRFLRALPYREYALKVLRKLPFLQCLADFSWKAHKAALIKFFVLLILASLPVIIATGVTPIPPGDASVWAKLLYKLRESITVPELFVYSAAFLTPILYLQFERIRRMPDGGLAGQIRKEARKSVFLGYWLVAFVAAILILGTAIAFGNIKAQTPNFENTFLHYGLKENAVLIYLYALYCWYLTLLDGEPEGDFVTMSRSGEKKATSGIRARLEEREAR